MLKLRNDLLLLPLMQNLIFDQSWPLRDNQL